jgi:hypothetical protein
VGALCIGVALLSAAYLDETFGKDLDYLEGDARAVPSPAGAKPAN